MEGLGHMLDVLVLKRHSRWILHCNYTQLRTRKHKGTEWLQLALVLAPAIAHAHRAQLRGWRKREGQAELTDGVVVSLGGLNELTGQVDFVVRSVSPVVGSPLKEQHVTGVAWAILYRNAGIEVQQLGDSSQRHQTRKSDPVRLGKGFELS